MIVVVVDVVEESERVVGGKMVVGGIEYGGMGIRCVIGGRYVGEIGFEGDKDGVVGEV